MSARTEGGIYLYPSGNSQGSFYILSLVTKTIKIRDQAKALPMPEEVVRALTARRLHPRLRHHHHRQRGPLRRVRPRRA
jgi:hypothetical protein